MVADTLADATNELWCIVFSWSHSSQQRTLTNTVYLNGQRQKDLSSKAVSINKLFSVPISAPQSSEAQHNTNTVQSAVWRFTRDTLASELIYFAEYEDGLLVANDLVTLRRLSGSQQANVQWLLNFFTFSDDFSDDTPFLGIEAIPSLACLIVDAQGHRLQRNTLPSAMATTQNSVHDMTTWDREQWVAEWRKRTHAAVQQSVVDISGDANVETSAETSIDKVAIMLSSGIDSAGIAAHLAALEKPLTIKAFSWRFPNHSQADESAAVQALVKHLQLSAEVDLHFVDIKQSDCFADIETWPVNLHVPHFNAMRRLKHRLYESAAEQGCTVLLNGHMGDELCFVDRYILVELWRDNKMACIAQIMQLLKSSFLSVNSMSLIRQNSALRLLCKTGYQNIEQRWQRFMLKCKAVLINTPEKRRHKLASGSRSQPSQSPPQRLSAAARKLFVQQVSSGFFQRNEQNVLQQFELGLEQSLRSEQFALLLANSELNAMAAETAFTQSYHLERRHPYLNPELVDLALRTPAYWLSTLPQPKWIARQALAGLLPEKFLSRSRTGQLDALFNDGLAQNCAAIRQYLFREERQWPQFIDEKMVADVLDQQRWEHAPAVIVPCLGLERWLDEWRAVGLPVNIKL